MCLSILLILYAMGCCFIVNHGHFNTDSQKMLAASVLTLHVVFTKAKKKLEAKKK